MRLSRVASCNRGSSRMMNLLSRANPVGGDVVGVGCNVLQNVNRTTAPNARITTTGGAQPMEGHSAVFRARLETGTSPSAVGGTPCVCLVAMCFRVLLTALRVKLCTSSGAKVSQQQALKSKEF